MFDQDETNIERLAAALQELSALYRDPMGRQIRPEAARLASKTGGGHHLLSTEAGDLDVLRESSGFDYARLVREAVELEVANMKVKFAPLRLIIEMKELADRPKDRAILPLLRAALEETQD